MWDRLSNSETIRIQPKPTPPAASITSVSGGQLNTLNRKAI